jgi:glycosyltransferase involved in cell wall biosynthesis
MIRLSRDPALAARLGSRARERVHAEFSMEKSIANLWDIIERAIQKK